ncbi:hypothetical protein HYH02_012114 [Chlamydomonas schloesseri]|uniref:ubiquitinyl hydrolase 1 n=1 Tax=Chlamydomonas schloesseri TaxID=2026947 RepID=A0A835TB44_9CHLO|nr:hypothetical protein HYH02_012114 [Chlamydomonas schloesseri]|eukprot:KAG2434916.1 hypothetical protein HYH02_012114 [Chlamydomonas schloesseri]
METEELYEAVPEDSMDADVVPPQVTDEAVVSASEAPKPMETESTGHYEWEIPNFAKLTQADKQVSEIFEIGTYLWRMLCFPRQNAAPHRHVSVFLEYPEASFTPGHLSPKASFKLIIKNFKDPSKDFSKGADHTFDSNQVDWGFSQMLPLTDISPSSGYLREDGALVVRVEITIQRDERFTYDSRAVTGYVGLKNQGATCYMNSLLQYLYNVPLFRKAVYHMPVPENEEPSKSLPVALQSLFYKLQYAPSAVSTKDLTASFGWNTYDAFMQHDVQELNRVLCEKLEEKMKNTKVEKAINELFEGFTHNFIECINVDYKSTRKESFMDLQLDVKGCKNVYDSFDKYTEVEVLNGQNQYKTDDFGMQDARKGILFESFPPVLQLQLKRFEYDFQRDAMVKINDRYEFYDELDLDRDAGKFLSPTGAQLLSTGDSSSAPRNTYKLHSVLVHSGGVHGGHYYAYIRPDGKQWLKFDDDRVTKAEPRDALEGQFGTGDDSGYGSNLKFAKCSNAYMLVYVRLADWNRVMCSVTKNDIAKHLLDRLEREQADKEARQRDKQQAHLFCSLKVASDADMRAQVGASDGAYFDLVDHDKLPAERCHFRLRKQTKFAEFKAEVAARTGIPVERQRFWTMKRRNNATHRPERALTPLEEASQLVDLAGIRELAQGAGHRTAGGGKEAKVALMDIRLYLEDMGEGEGVVLSKELYNGPNGKGSLLLFFKYYDPAKETLTFKAHHLLPNTIKLQAVAEILQEELELEAGEAAGSGGELELWEEVKFEPTVMVDSMDQRSTLAELGLNNGDIIIYQRRLSTEEAAAVRYPTAQKFLEYVHNRRMIHFKKLEDPAAAPAVTLELLRGATYDQVAEALAEALQLPDPSKLRFTQHNVWSGQPLRGHIRFRSCNSLEGMLQSGQRGVGAQLADTLYFEVLDLPLEEMEQLKTVRVAFHNERGEFVGEQHTIRLRRDSPVSELLAELANRLQQQPTAASAAAVASNGGAEAAGVTAEAGAEAGPGVKAEEAAAAGGGQAAPAAAGGPAGAAAAARAEEEAASLKAAAELAAAGRPMRLLELGDNRICKIVDPDERVESLNVDYWQRAEFVPEDQLPDVLGPRDYIMQVVHYLPPPLSARAAAAWAASAAAGAASDAGEPMDADGGSDTGGANNNGDTGANSNTADDADASENEGDRSTGGRGGRGAAAAKSGEELLKDELADNMPGAAFGDPLLIRVTDSDTLGKICARLQPLLGVTAEEMARWRAIFVGSRPQNAVPAEDKDLAEDFQRWRNGFYAPAAMAAAAVGGTPTQATLVDPSKLVLALLHEDKGLGHGGAPRRAPPSTSRYTYEKPVKIYG